MTSISKSRIDSFIEDINKALTRTDVNNIREQAVNEDNYKQSAIDEINSLSDLPKSEKTGYINRAKQAAKTETIDKIVVEAKTKEQEILLELQKQATINSINALTKLTPEEKNGYITRIKNAVRDETITNIYQEAVAKNQEKALNPVREQYVGMINGLSEIIEEEKTGFIERINSATSEEEIKNIYNEADLKNSVAVNVKAINLKESIAPEEKQGFITRINSAKTKEEIDSIYLEADLKDTQTRTIKIINSLDKLTPEEQQGFIERINAIKASLTASAEVNQIYVEAYQLATSKS